MKIDNLVFSNLTVEKVLESIVDIFFTVEDQAFSIRTLNQQGFYRPTFVYHESLATCPLCRGYGLHSGCSVLLQELWQVFLKLVEHPSIRLEWLYLPYYTSEAMVEYVIAEEISKLSNTPDET